MRRCFKLEVWDRLPHCLWALVGEVLHLDHPSYRDLFFRLEVEIFIERRALELWARHEFKFLFVDFLIGQSFLGLDALTV